MTDTYGTTATNRCPWCGHAIWQHTPEPGYIVNGPVCPTEGEK